MGSPKRMPKASASSRLASTRAACSSAFEGMQPTFRHTPPRRECALDQRHAQAEVGGAEGGGVPAGATAEHDQARARPSSLTGGIRRGSASRPARWVREPRGQRAVDDPVVVGERQRQDQPRPELAVDPDRLGRASARGRGSRPRAR